jgi:hypothetical protein
MTNLLMSNKREIVKSALGFFKVRCIIWAFVLKHQIILLNYVLLRIFNLYPNTAYTFIVILGCYKCNECRRIFTIFTRFSKYLYIADRSFQPIKYFKMNLPIWYKNKRNQTKRIKPEETKSRRKCCISFNFVFSDLRSCKLEWRQQK